MVPSAFFRRVHVNDDKRPLRFWHGCWSIVIVNRLNGVARDAKSVGSVRPIVTVFPVSDREVSLGIAVSLLNS